MSEGPPAPPRRGRDTSAPRCGSGRRTVLYLDVDDTLLRYPDGRDRPPVPAAGAADFLDWALERYEVRWLTRWCRTGVMHGELLASFCKLLGADPGRIGAIRGLDWSCSDTKLDGIAWLEHFVVGRRFLWIEDEYGVREWERAVLDGVGFGRCWRLCNVTRSPGALETLHRTLRREDRRREGSGDECADAAGFDQAPGSRPTARKSSR